MQLIEDHVLAFLDWRTSGRLRVCSSEKLGDLKFQVCLIEKWWKHISLKKWVKKVYDKFGLSFCRRSLSCRICRKSASTDVVFLNNKLIFCCNACYFGVESDLISEIYPQMYTPLHAEYSEYSNNIYFTPILLEEIDFGFENCRTQ